MKRTEAECRVCGIVALCDNRTLDSVERVSHDEGRADIDYTVTTGLCDDCLPVPDEAQDESEARAEREYRDLYGSEL
jgi:hypothetical protein